MIASEHFKVNERNFIRTYSDSGRYVMLDGVEYSEACDPAELGRQYTEGNPMPVDEADASEILDIILGGCCQ